MQYTLHTLKATANAISQLLHPFAEVVIHDLHANRIVAIFNAFSKRHVGDDSYLDDFKKTYGNDLPHVIGPYEKINTDGRPLKCITSTISNEQGQAIGLFCINIDVSVFTQCQHLLHMFLPSTKPSKETNALFKNDLHHKVQTFVQNYCISQQTPIHALTKTQKKAIIVELKAQGALNEKNASSVIAHALSISRQSVYNYLKATPCDTKTH